jgi:hypothetical protein
MNNRFISLLFLLNALSGCIYAPTTEIANGLSTEERFKDLKFQNKHYIVSEYTIEVPLNTIFLSKSLINNPENTVCAYRVKNPRLVRKSNTSKKYPGALAAIDYEWYQLKQLNAGGETKIVAAGEDTIYDGTVYNTVFHDVTVFKDYYKMTACLGMDMPRGQPEWHFPTTFYIGSGYWWDENRQLNSKYRTDVAANIRTLTALAPTPWNDIGQVNLSHPKLVWYEKDMKRPSKTVKTDEMGFD